MCKIIKIENLSFGYDNNLVLENINLEIATNEFLAIIGPNGGGKSTLLKIILGLEKPKHGTIVTQNSNIGYVPQNTNINLNFPITARDVVLMGYDRRNKIFFSHPQENIDKANEILKIVNMEQFASSKISSLSGGQRQRVMIARALFGDPQILVLDEPTSNIDSEGQKQIFELLKKLNEKMTIIVVSHDISVALDYADSIAYVNKKISSHKSNPIDSTSFMEKFKKDGQHFCEIEMMQMLKKGLL